MKKLSQYISNINEWKANSSSISSIKQKGTGINLIYKVNEKSAPIQIFYCDFRDMYHYSKKIYINNVNVEINKNGATLYEFVKGTYNIHIDCDELTYNCTSMFESCDQLKQVVNIDCKGVTQMNGMFYKCKNLEYVNQIINTDEVTTMRGMFAYCENLKTAPYLKTPNVDDMGCMFLGCKNLKDVPLYDTTNVTGMYNTFCWCNLSTKSIQEWSSVYDFKIHKMKE